MWRHRTICHICGQASDWRREREESRKEILRHLQEAHGRDEVREPEDYQLIVQRQCDSCLEPNIDRCTKCDGDFCVFHAGDIDGLCGGCI
jgi:hypothetical protein